MKCFMYKVNTLYYETAFKSNKDIQKENCTVGKFPVLFKFLLLFEC